MARPRLFKPLPAEPGSWEFPLGESVISYRVKRSDRLRDWRLEFSEEEGLVVVLPRDAEVASVPEILTEKKRWVLKQLAEASRRRENAARRQPRDGGYFLYRGRDVPIKCDPAGVPPGKVRLEQDVLRVGASPDDGGALREALRRWLRREARRVISVVLQEESSRLKVPYRKVFFRNQRTRWASWSNAGNISLNYHLVMAPDGVMRYVVVHELIHHRTLRHGKRFRQLLRKYFPDYRRAEKWLRENEVYLNI